MKPGTKPGTKFSVAHCKAIVEGLRRAMDNGWRPIKHTPEEHQRRVIMAGQTMAKRPQRLDTVCGKHKDNKNAKWWKFENKGLGKTIEGKNLSQLVRDNETLFDSTDVQWKDSSCRAAGCLRSLKSAKKRTRNSWKGWVICTPSITDRTEEFDNWCKESDDGAEEKNNERSKDTTVSGWPYSA